MKRIRSKKDDVILFKLSDDLFCVAQRLENQIMRFFDIFSATEDIAENIDLHNVNILFDVIVSTDFLEKNYAVKKIKNCAISTIPYAQYWITTHDIFSPYFKPSKHYAYGLGGKLIDLSKGHFSIWDAPVVKNELSVEIDRDMIEKYELVNMWGNDLIERLIRYHTTGINRDDMKFELFPTLWNDREKLRPLTSRLPEPLR